MLWIDSGILSFMRMSSFLCRLSLLINQTTGHWYSVAPIEKTLTVRSERSRASGEVEEQAGREFSGLRLRYATLGPNGDRINRQ